MLSARIDEVFQIQFFVEHKKKDAIFCINFRIGIDAISCEIGA